MPRGFYCTINGGAPQTTGVSTGGEFTLPVPTGTATTYNYVLVSIQDNDCAGAPVAITGQDVQVQIDPAPATVDIEIIAGVIPLCYNGTTTVTIRPESGFSSYQWFVTGFPPGPGSPISGATSRNYTTNQAGYYTVQVTGANGCSAYSNGFQVTQRSSTPANAIFGEHNEVHDSRCIHHNPDPLQLINVGGGIAPLTYQWQSSPDGTNWTNIGGATSSSYDPSNDMAVVGNYYYRAIISDDCASFATDPKRITIVADPTVTVNAGNTTFCQNQSVSIASQFNFNITGGSATYSWVWQYSTSPGGPFTNITGSNPNIPTGTAGTFYFQVVLSSAPCNPITSTNQSTETINSLPVITDHPDDITACPGDDVTFNVTASGSGLIYQWRRNGSNVGGNFPFFTENNVNAGDNGNDYEVIVTNACGSVTSSEATLTVSPPVTAGTINTTGGTFCVNWSATINSTAPATGQGLTYTWQRSVGCTGTCVISHRQFR